jgi:ADP-ribose pyrophosphatase YjhB (NUDIX family)
MELFNFSNLTQQVLNSYQNKASCIFIHNNNKVLSVSRKFDSSDLGLIGGKLDKNETYIDCIVRKVKEETGLTIYPDKIIPIFSASSESGELCKNNSECNCICFYTKDYDGEINTSEQDKVKLVKWVEYEKLYNGSFSKYNTKVIEILKSKKFI